MTGAAPLLALFLGAQTPEPTLAVLAVADPPGPEPELAEMTHHLRAACRERTPGVQEVAEMRQRLLGQASGATLAELERAYGGALATYQNGEYESSIRTLYAVIDDLERLPEGPEAYSQWVRALQRLAHAEATVGHGREAREAMERLLAVEPRLQPDPDQYSPTYRREFEGARARVAARPRRKLSIDAGGWSAAVFVNGKTMGTAPASASLPPGRYRVGGQAGTLRVPSLWVELRHEDRTVALDFGLAEALRVSSGPGLALGAADRPAGVVRAGAWLGVDRVIAAHIARENDVPFLAGTLFDVRRGAAQREGRVRLAAGSVPQASLGALAAFLLTGQASKEVIATRSPSAPAISAAAASRPVAAVPLPPPPVDARPGSPTGSPTTAAPVEAAPSATAAAVAPPVVSAPPAAPSVPPHEPIAVQGPTQPPRPAVDLRPARRPDAVQVAGRSPAPAWVRPAAWGSGAAALGFGALAAWQGLESRSKGREAAAMLRPDGTLLPGADLAAYDRARSASDAARRNAWAAAVGSAALAAAAGALGWYGYR